MKSDHYEEHIQAPQFIGRDIGSIYDWNVTTAPQTQLDGATRPLPLGRAVGGGSIINGMVWNRGNQDDYNSWQSLGNAGWAWTDLLPYFKKVRYYLLPVETILNLSSSQRRLPLFTTKGCKSNQSRSLPMHMDGLVLSLSATLITTGLNQVSILRCPLY